MHQLVAQDIEAVKQGVQHKPGVFSDDRLMQAGFAAVEPLLPILVTFHAVMVLPERLIDIGIVHDQPDRAGKFLPDGIIDHALAVEGQHLFQKAAEHAALGGGVHVRNVLGIGGVEGNPEKNEGAVAVVAILLGAVHPADRAMDPQAEIRMEAIAQPSLLVFEMDVVVVFGCHGVNLPEINSSQYGCPPPDCNARSLQKRMCSLPVSVMSHL